MSTSPTEAPASPEAELRWRSRPTARWLLTAAVGILVGGLAAFVVAPRADDGAPSPVVSASPSPTAVATSSSPTSTPEAASDPRYPAAPALDADALARVGDLWRLESVTTFRDDAAPGPTVVYLVSPGGDRYLAGTVATPELTLLAWDVENDAALVGGRDFVGDETYFRLDLATGIAVPDDPPAPHESWAVSRLGVGVDDRTYFALGSYPIEGSPRRGAWAWSAAGWDELILPASIEPYSNDGSDAIVTGSEWMLWAEDTNSYPRTDHLFKLSTGIDSPIPSLGDTCSTDGWHDATHLDVYCWPDGETRVHRLYDVSTQALSEAPDWSLPTDGYIYSSTQLPGTPLVFRFDDRPGFVSTISVLTADGLQVIAEVAPEDQFQIGDVIEVRSGTYVIRDGVGYTPGNEIVRAVIDVVAGFVAFGSPSDPYWQGELPPVGTTILVNFEGE